MNDRCEGVNAVFAGVSGFFCAFIEFVAASVAAVGVAGAGGADELANVREAVSTVFTIVVCHRL